MSKNHVKAALIGGLIVFVWGMFSWMVFPWHQKCFHKFADESDVAGTIRDNTNSCGVYILPNTFAYKEGTSQKTINRGMEMMEKGPFMFAVVHPNGMGKMTAKPFVVSLVIQWIGAFIVTWMLLQTKGLSFRRKVGFVVLFGLGAGVLGELPSWNWWGFPFGFVFINILDLVIAWFLAGLAMAKILHPKR